MPHELCDIQYFCLQHKFLLEIQYAEHENNKHG